MKKLLLFVLLAALFPFTRMQAEVTRATQLFGTWQFTADIELTDDGQAYSDIISNNCEVTITSHSLYDFTISGFAGATTDIRANFYTTTTPASIRFMNTSMSGYNPWGTGIDVSTDGETYPASNYRMYMDPDNDNVINVTDFYIVYAYYDSSIGDYGEYVVTPLAHVTNGTLTLIEKAYVEITDLSGDWHFTSTASMADSELPTEFDFNLESNSGSFDPYSVNDGSCAYFTATLSFEGYDPVLIEDAAFDGYQIEIPFNDTYLDEANNIAFYVYNSTSREGSITFKKNSDISLSLDAAFAIGQETTIEEADTLITLQYYTDGSAAKQVDSYDFSGTYHITVDNIIYSGVDEYTSYPETFDMVITYNSAVSKYYITSFLGNDTYSLNQGGIPAVATTTDDGNNILKIAVGNTRYVARIDDDGSYQYHVLYNGLGLATDSIQLTVSYDGTITMEDFTLYHINYGSSDAQLAAYFQNLTVTKEGEAE
ncbi:MAG: hypothetical protein LUI04_06170, partial [Porphyromonadaceae bacterium]|nr:hypothetical protein [Porphyromonadaceae bacterium]